GKRTTTTSTTTAQTTSYGYDAIGQRIRKTTTAGNTTQYFYDEQGHLTGEYDGSGQLIQEIIWLGDLPIAVLKPATPTDQTTATIDFNYIHADHLGTPRAITRPSDNKVVWRWESEAFGNSLPEQNPSGLGSFVFNLRFPGQYYDQEAGLFYNVFRDYNPATGRYIESDPIGLAGGINTYAYVGGNPVNFTDPKGLNPVAAAIGLCRFFPAQCVAAAAAAAKSCVDGVTKMFSESSSEDAQNTNPYAGPVDESVIVVDKNGNAIPVEEGQQINTSPNGDYQQVIGGDGRPTGDRLDRGGHRGQSDPRAQQPHAHRPGVTTPDGNPHLPIY
ncbi:MAG: RHS repeat domain-containing protein, partial [Methylobacter sp.]